jgi:hypothetical protein
MPLLVCPECKAKNRVAVNASDARRPICGKCQRALPDVHEAMGPADRELVESAGPLLDPVAWAARLLVLGALISAARLLWQFGQPVVDLANEHGWAAVGAALRRQEVFQHYLLTLGMPLLALIATTLAYVVIFREVRRPKVFFLRAFRSDSDGGAIRRLLRVALGSGLRLTGIRPPRERPGLLVRLLLPVATAFRSVQSAKFDLEANDHNWMARLLASYGEGRFAIIDVRDTTPHVEDEIQLTYLRFGTSGCVFLTDASRSQVEWENWLGDALELPRKEAARLRLLAVEETGTREADQRMVAKAAECFAAMPGEASPIPAAAVGFVKKRVPEEQWPTAFLETSRGLTVAYVALMLAAMGAIQYFRPPAKFVTWGVYSVFGLTLLFYAVAWWRSRMQLRLAARCGMPVGLELAALAFSAFVIFGLPLAATGAIFLFEKAATKARDLQCLTNLRMLGSSLAMAELDHSELPRSLDDEAFGQSLEMNLGERRPWSRCRADGATALQYVRPKGGRVEFIEDPGRLPAIYCPKHESCLYWDSRVESGVTPAAFEAARRAAAPASSPL